jgi:hypothetical protein
MALFREGHQLERSTMYATILVVATAVAGQHVHHHTGRPGHEYSCDIRIYSEERATVITPTPSDVGFLDALEKACEGLRDRPDEKGVTTVDLVCEGGRSRYHVWGKGSSLHEAVNNALWLAKEDLKK